MRLVLLLALLVSCGLASASTADCADPEAIEAFEAGQALLDSRNLAAGISKIEQAVSIDPNFIDAYEKLAELFNQLNRYDDSIRVAEQLMRLRPERADDYQYSIKRYRSLADTPRAAIKALERCRAYEAGSKKAIAACKKAIGTHPKYADAHYFLGVNYIYADDEIGAKKEIAALVLLDPKGAAPVLIHTMEHLKPEWLTEEYGDELRNLFAMDATPAKEPEILKFTSQEIDQILEAYSEQVAALKSLLDDFPEIIPAECKERVSDQLPEQLREKLLPLGIGYVYAERPNCFGNHPRTYHFFDEFMINGPANKIGTELNVGRPEYENWRVGRIQMLERRKYCKPVCQTLLEFRIDTEIRGDPYQFKARMKSLDETLETGQCAGVRGEEWSSWDW